MKKLCIISFCMLYFILPIKANSQTEVTFSKCTDGDTAHFIMDDEDITVRFLAINAPEYTKIKEAYGKEASTYVCDVLTNANTITLEFDDNSELTDKYGRTLAWVFVDGKLLQKELVSQGLAEVKYLYGDYTYTQELQEAEKVAKENQLQMWSDKTSNQDVFTQYSSVVFGVLLIIIGIFFTKGKKQKRRMIKKGFAKFK